MSAKITAYAGNICATVDARRPRWEDVYAGYPLVHKGTVNEMDMPADTVFKSVFGEKYDTIKFQNACATRVSIALIKAKMELKRDFIVQTKEYYGKGFITSVKGLQEWLTDVWGIADKIIDDKSSLEDVAKIINGRSGVYIILNGSAQKNHATLWVGANNNVIGGNHYIGAGCIVYFWELLKRETFIKFKNPVVIDRYRMPGLNSAGLDIADDMCYGYGTIQPRPIYDKITVDGYKGEYLENGFEMDKHKKFSNDGFYSTDSKGIYNIGSVLAVVDLLHYSEYELFNIFRELGVKFSILNPAMEKIIISMIEYFKRNCGGIYETEELTKYIKAHSSTKRYCDGLENYIHEMLINSKGVVYDLEDKNVYWKQENENVVDVVRRRAETIGKNFSLTPIYNPVSSKELIDFINGKTFFKHTREKLDNTFSGYTFAINDVWATEVKISEYALNGCEYSVKYQVTLWDHFGLDAGDLDPSKPARYIKGFHAWFILQHFYGYKPFIVRIRFENEFRGIIKRWN